MFTLRCDPSKNQNRPLPASRNAVQHPSPMICRSPFGKLATPAFGHGNNPPAVRPSPDTWKVSALTSVLFQTSCFAVGSSTGNRDTVEKSPGVFGVLPVPTYTQSRLPAVSIQTASPKPGVTSRLPVPSQLTTKTLTSLGSLPWLV